VPDVRWEPPNEAPGQDYVPSTEQRREFEDLKGGFGMQESKAGN
jgi:hypothetical protein